MSHVKAKDLQIMLFQRRRCVTIAQKTGRGVRVVLSVPLVLAAVICLSLTSPSSWRTPYCGTTNHGHVSALQVSMMMMPSSPPIFGIGAILFPVRGTTISVLGGDSDNSDDVNDIRRDIDDATDFFVDAFWTAKVGGGTSALSPRQRQQLVQSQQAEFNKRYGGRRRNSANNKKSASAFLIMRGPKRKKKRTSTRVTSTTNAMLIDDDDNDDDDRGEILACVGIEVQGIADGAVRGLPIQEYAPLMSNLAVSRQYRRRGLAEAMVQAAEDYITNRNNRRKSNDSNNNDWPEEYRESLYLYVERRNTRALQLYQKLGYRRLWQDGNAQTLLPLDNGDLQSVPTVLVCMKKNLTSRNPLARWFG